MTELEKLARLAGFTCGHAVWCVSDGEPLIPMILWADATGQRTMERMGAERLEQGVQQQKERMDQLAGVATLAVAAYDGYLDLGGQRTDTVLIEARNYESEPIRFELGQPYTPKKFLKKFAIHRLKILDQEGIDDSQMETFVAAFYEGVAEHSKGAEIFRKNTDESK